MIGQPERILVVLPNWVGDVVLATPALRAIRRGFARSRITFLARQYVADLIAGADWMDEVTFWPAGKSRTQRRQGFLWLASRLRQQRFELAVLLANSFRSALLALLAGAVRRVGYDRDGRGLLLTDRLIAHRLNGRFIPVSMMRYYNGLADYLGCRDLPAKPELPVRQEDVQATDELCRAHGITPERPLVLINPGAAFGSAKCWLPERFADLADRLTETTGARVLVVCGPREQATGQSIRAMLRHDATVLADPPLSLRELMGLVQRCDLLVTNDTGPRHLAIAYDVPVVTIFGPTDPRWTETNYMWERKVIAPVDCGPCMKRLCPLDHRCMSRIDVEMVLEPAIELLRTRRCVWARNEQSADEQASGQPWQGPAERAG